MEFAKQYFLMLMKLFDSLCEGKKKEVRTGIQEKPTSRSHLRGLFSSGGASKLLGARIDAFSATKTYGLEKLAGGFQSTKKKKSRS